MKRIPLSKQKFALVDDEDFERIAQLRWQASLESRGTKWYAIRRETIDGKVVKIRMHHFVLGIRSHELPPGFVVDHKNHDSLDNRRENLEIITQRENMLRSKNWKRRKEPAREVPQVQA